MKNLFINVLNMYYNKTALGIVEQDGGWSAGAFKIETEDGTFFLKVYDKQRASTNLWTATINAYMPIVIWLHTNTALNGRIVCPILTIEGKYKCEDERYIYLLFPYIDGYTLCDKPMSNNQMKEMAEIIAELHKYGTEVPVPTDVIKENFAVPFCAELKEILLSPVQKKDVETTNILMEHKQTLLRYIEKTELLSKKSVNKNLPFVLCHTDVHGWNMMQSERLILIDWEGMKLAPPEADLFAFVGNLFWHNCSDEFMNIYQEVHPNFRLNQEVLDFYQIRRRIEDICAFAQGLLFEDIDDEDRKQSLYHLRRECIALLKMSD